MKKIKAFINGIWFFISVAMFAVALIYTFAFIVDGLLHGFLSGNTIDDWFYGLVIGINAINSLHNVKEARWWWKPFGSDNYPFSEE